MSEPIATPSNRALREKWNRDGALHHVWKALSLDNTADCLQQMESAESELSGDQLARRTMALAMCRKFVEAERDEELLAAYNELKEYFQSKGA